MNTRGVRSSARIAVPTVVLLFLIGVWALDLQAKQARDTTRKLDLEDLETALNRTLAIAGTLPPAEEPTWCGVINAPENAEVQAAIERALRETEKYENPAKPFPRDATFGGTERDYAYWKTSPVSFELLAHLEADDNNSRPLDLERCELAPTESGPKVPQPVPRSPEGEVGSLGEGGYDYAIISTQRTPL